MKLLLSLALVLPIVATAQTVADVQTVAAMATANNTPIQTITGTDGTVCNLTKVAGKTIYAAFGCSLAGQTMKPIPIQSTSSVSGYVQVGQGSVLCLIGINPTATGVSFGSVGTAPPVGIAWACIPGPSGTIVSGSIIWP